MSEVNLFSLMAEAIERVDRSVSRQAFYMSEKVYGYLTDIRRRMRRTKRRARYNRGKQGVRPRMRCGR